MPQAAEAKAKIVKVLWCTLLFGFCCPPLWIGGESSFAVIAQSTCCPEW